MPTTLTIKNIPPDLYELLKKSAAKNRRSINQEVITIIEAHLGYKKLSPEEFLASARKLREKVKRGFLTDDLIKQAKSNGRP